MKKHLTNCVYSFKQVYSSVWTFVLTVIVSVCIYSFNVLIKNYSFLLESFSLKITWLMLAGSVSAMPLSAYLLLSVMSILTGIVVTFAVYLIRRQVKHSAKAGVAGIIAGIVAPGCASCALGFLSIIGLSGFVAYLPFNGLELGFVGIGVLVVSIFYLSNKVVGVCEIEKKEKN